MENAATDRLPVVLWVGTYPAQGPDGPAGTGEGIWRLELDPRSGAVRGDLAVRTAAPSFLAWGVDGRTVLAVGETAQGTVSAFRRADDDSLEPLGTVSSGGAWPCHLLVHPEGHAAYVSNYGSGSLGVLTLEDGALSPEVLEAGGPVQVFEGSGSGPQTDRQDGPHAHSALLAPGGRHLLVADLGSDELRRYRVLADGRLEADGVAHTFPPGTGPRHVAVGPRDHLYVVGELSVTVHVLAWDTATGTATQVQQLPACTSPLASGEHIYPAHVVVVPAAAAGGQVLVSVRGADVLSRFAVRDDGARLTHLGDVPLGGTWPRHFAVAPDPAADDDAIVDGVPEERGGRWVVAALQNSDRVSVTPVAAAGPVAGGGTVVAHLEVPVPACVAVDPAR